MCMGILLVLCTYSSDKGHQRGYQNPLGLELQMCPPQGCWQRNPGPVKEQPILLATEPSPHCSETGKVVIAAIHET